MGEVQHALVCVVAKATVARWGRNGAAGRGGGDEARLGGRGEKEEVASLEHENHVQEDVEGEQLKGKPG